jgi:KDO2-lipid IV(A) lauroyltransferase
MAKRNNLSSKIRYGLENIVLEIFTLAIRYLSAQQVFRMGNAIGELVYKLSTRRRRIGLINLDIAFGDRKTSSEKKSILQNSYRQIGVSTLQSIWLRHNTRERVQELLEEEPKGLDELWRCLEKNKGVFFLTAHFSNWEWMGLHHGYQGIGKLNSIVRRLDNPHIDQKVKEFRTVSGNGIFYRDEPALKIVRALKNKECVAVMMDQNTALGGVFVEFFGKKAATARALAQLSRKLETPILPLFSYATGKGTYRIEYGPELVLEKGQNKTEDIATWTRSCERYIESAIERQPESWLWEHRRWKTRPPNEEKLY